MINDFQDIVVWQKAHKLTLLIYKVSSRFPKSELFGVTSQIRRSSASIAANIVEGFTRRTKNDRYRFYTIADGSLAETKYFIILAKDLKLLSNEEYNTIINLIHEVGRLLNGWMKTQK